jgi:RND family efflux transporter MFP subunit
MLRPIRFLLPTAVVLAVGLLSGCSKPPQAEEPVRSVKVMTVVGQAPEFATEYAGEVKARTESRLGFRVAGKLVSRAVDVGQHVNAGQVLAHIDGTDYGLSADAARAQLQSAQTQLDLARADLKRYQELKAQNFISGAELERREATYQSAEATVAQARAQSSVQVNQKGYTTLVADKPGVVVAVEAEPGQVLSAGTPVLRLALDGPRDVMVAVPENKLAGIVPGRVARVRMWASDATFSARVHEVAASADPVSRTFAVKLALDGAAVALPPLGSTAYVQWQAASTPAVQAPVLIKLPTSALRQEGQGSAVWLWDEASGTVHSQPVVVSTADGNQAVIASGLKGGEKVVVAGVHVLTEGQKVTLYVEKNLQNSALTLSIKEKIATNGDASAAAAPVQGKDKP